MAGLQLSGLASGLDWKSLVDQLMQIESAPVTKMTDEQDVNTQKVNALDGLNTKLDALKAASTALSDVTLFNTRNVASSLTGSTWGIKADAGGATGSYKIAVSQIATTARREGAADIAGGLSTTDDVSAATLATLTTSTAITAGTFSINGQKVTVATTDTLQSVFDAISTATGGDVTASYSAATDKITLTSGSGTEISLGATNDTSNFLRAIKLGNNGTGSVTSFGLLGTLKTSATLDNSGLRGAITAVDGTGAGSFTINGTTISYNIHTDSLSTVLKRINQSAAGVTASYDNATDRVVLNNNSTGDMGIAVSETGAGLLGALGLTTGGTFVRGQDAAFKLNDGATIYSASNTLDSKAHGIDGLTVTVDSATTQTISVSSDTSGMKSKIQGFVDAYNSVRLYIDDKTKITSADGKVTTSILSDNREVQEWQRTMRTMAFGSVAGLSGTINRLENLGIDFDSDGRLSVKDSDKLDTALRDHSGDVEEFFQTSNTGFAAKFTALVSKLHDDDDGQQERLNASNKDIDRQIADLQRRLDAERQRMTDAFVQMETMQSQLKSQSDALTRSFGA
jgi:flagellar hook-associated protein 2